MVKFRYAGFAVLALDCIVLESLWGFMNGKKVPRGKEKKVYRDILRQERFVWTETQADDFREYIRNGLMHDAETRNRWIVKMTRQNAIVEKNPSGDYVLNRTKFHEALCATVEDWLKRVRSGEPALRENLRIRMDEIIKSHYTARRSVGEGEVTTPERQSGRVGSGGRGAGDQ